MSTTGGATQDKNLFGEDVPPEPGPVPDGSEQAARQVEAVAEIIRTRAGHHGDAVEQHKMLAFLWNSFLANPMREKGDRLTAADVAYMLGLLKVSRVFSGGLQKQHVEDEIGYGGIVLAAMEADA